MEYPKINSLWKRDNDHNFIEGEYSCPEFANIKHWNVQEKIDGTNVRIFINKTVNTIQLFGRTSHAQIPPKLLTWFQNKSFDLDVIKSENAYLFGEGFGAGIQSGGIYRRDVSFILFDIYMNGRWSTREEVKEIANLLDLETPHDFGIMTQDDIISFVKSKPHGEYGDKKYIIEGVVCRSEPLMRFNNRSANPVTWKLKVRDFK